MDITVSEIAEIVGGSVVGDGAVRITGLNGIRDARQGDLTFLAEARYASFLESTQASAVLVPSECHASSRALIQVSDPYGAFAQMLKTYEAETLRHPSGIDESARVGERTQLGADCGLGAHTFIGNDCTIGDRVVLYPGVFVGNNCQIGPDTVVYPNAVIREGVSIGARCLIHSNASIGSDGFGFLQINGHHQKIPQVGTVEIGDEVEIGANTAIDRATCGKTVIGEGTKIDNLVQVGHNVKIGRHCVISGGTAIAGSTTIGNQVTMGGCVAVTGHIEVGDNVIVGGGSEVAQSVEPNRIVSGYGPKDHELSKRVLMSQARLPQALRRLRNLERQVQELEERLNG